MTPQSPRTGGVRGCWPTPASSPNGRRRVHGYVDYHNNVRLNSTTDTSRRRKCWRGGSKRSGRSATGSWRRRGSEGRFVASKPFDVQIAARCMPCY